jgi:hypothetical protein
MNEIIPPSQPGQSPPPPEFKPPMERRPPNKKLCTFYGFLLFVICGCLTYFFPPMFCVGLIAAFVSLFFDGYRFICVGYALTLGLLLLAVIIYCSTHPFNV